MRRLDLLLCDMVTDMLQAEAGANVAIWYNSNKKALDEAANIEKTYGVKCE